MALCRKLAKPHTGAEPPERSREFWAAWIEKEYMTLVQKEQAESHTRRLGRVVMARSKEGGRIGRSPFRVYTLRYTLDGGR